MSEIATANHIPPRVILSILAGYIVLTAIIVGVMFLLRDSVVANLSTSEAKANWQGWRTKAAQDDGMRSPIQRSVPRSAEPPALVLMRDYFTAVIVGLLLPITGLYVFVAWIALGLKYSQIAPSRRGDAEKP
jgi:hypothetical protein